MLGKPFVVSGLVAVRSLQDWASLFAIVVNGYDLQAEAWVYGFGPLGHASGVPA